MIITAEINILYSNSGITIQMMIAVLSVIMLIRTMKMGCWISGILTGD